jgi:predicted NAD/FAD-dependent oxidoreductase
MQFDHGAQYIIVRSPVFSAELDALLYSGSVAAWDYGGDERRLVGSPDMAALANRLANGLDVRQQMEVTSLRPVEGGWRIRTGNIESAASRVVVTVPAPQVPRLIGPDNAVLAELESVHFEPCLTLMAAVGAEASFATRTDPKHPLAWIAQDSSKPERQRNGTVAWVAQAGPEFSRRHLEKGPDAMVAAMLPLLCDRLDVALNRVTYAEAHRWRYARVAHPLGRPSIAASCGTLHLAGDWCLGDNVEAAWESGTAAAESILACLE